MSIVVLNRSTNAKRFYNWITNDILLIEERRVTNVELVLSCLSISRLLDSSADFFQVIFIR